MNAATTSRAAPAPVAPPPIPPDPAAPDHLWPGRWPRRDGLELGAYPEAVPCARARAREILREWGLAPLADDTALVVSELMTNAVRSTMKINAALTAGAAAPRRAGRVPEPVRMWLLAGLSRVMVLVWDAAPDIPRRTEAACDDESGRGLAIVEAYSARWGWYTPPPPHAGKVVWSLLDAACQ